ncbi:MAG: hypothetical protein RLZZ551_209, partial [Actinomycetota bacterium]
ADVTAKPNSIVNSFNRNFPKRNDGSANTLSFVTSPDTVIAIALSGRLDFDPTVDTITAPDGTEVLLSAPVGEVLPANGYDPGVDTFTQPPADGSKITVAVSPTSDRLQLLEPFTAWDGSDYIDLPVLMKAKGKCTTDHISAAGKWLTYRGHLENISGNLFIGAINAFNGATGEGKDITDGGTRLYPEIAKRYSQAGISWCAIGDQNYGEGSSREHAAMEPRFRGGVVIFARSFARIHETNLKKQGLVPLTFSDPATYELIGEDDRISVMGLPPVPDKPITCRITKADGSTVDFEAKHTFSPEQVEWFKAGSALNIVRKNLAKKSTSPGIWERPHAGGVRPLNQGTRWWGTIDGFFTNRSWGKSDSLVGYILPHFWVLLKANGKILGIFFCDGTSSAHQPPRDCRPRLVFRRSKVTWHRAVQRFCPYFAARKGLRYHPHRPS